MKRSLLAGVAALALMTGAALAQDLSDAPPAKSYGQTTTQRSTDAFGNQVERVDSFHKSQSVAPGESRTSTTTSSQTMTVPSPYPPGPAVVVAAPPPVYVAPGDNDDDDYVADAPYPPGPPTNYSETTTTRTLNNGGVQTDHSKSVQTDEAYVDEDGQLSAHTTTQTKTHSTTVSPPSQVIPAPPPPADMPSSTTTTTTTTRY